MELIKNNFYGKTPLWQVFWIQNMLMGTIIQYVVDSVVPHLSMIPIYCFVAFVLAYSIWVLVGLWQCAFNANWKGCGFIVRGLYVLIFSVVIISLLRGL